MYYIYIFLIITDMGKQDMNNKTIYVQKFCGWRKITVEILNVKNVGYPLMFLKCLHEHEGYPLMFLKCLHEHPCKFLKCFHEHSCLSWYITIFT